MTAFIRDFELLWFGVTAFIRVFLFLAWYDSLHQFSCFWLGVTALIRVFWSLVWCDSLHQRCLVFGLVRQPLSKISLNMDFEHVPLRNTLRECSRVLYQIIPEMPYLSTQQCAVCFIIQENRDVIRLILALLSCSHDIQCKT